MRDDDVDGGSRGGPESPEGRRGIVAEDGFGARREHGRHPPSLSLDQPVTDEIDAGVEPMEAPGPEPCRYRASTESSLFHLPTADHPMLPLGDFCQPAVVIASPRKGILKMTFRGLGWHPLRLAGAGSYLVR